MAIVLDGSSGITTPDVDSGTGTFSGAVQVSGVATNLYPLVSGTAVSASGTAVDFTGIPSWVKRITVMFSGVSTNGSSNLLLQAGAGSTTTTGYLGSGSSISNGGYSTSLYTTGFGAKTTDSSACIVYGSFVLESIAGNTWVANGNFARSDNSVVGTTAGQIALSGTLDRIRITTVNGTDTFDAGTINIMYE